MYRREAVIEGTHLTDMQALPKASVGLQLYPTSTWQSPLVADRYSQLALAPAQLCL